MKIQKDAKLFAFKLAEKQVQAATPAPQWQVRDGVALAGCSGPVDPYDNYKDYSYWPGSIGNDKGMYC